MITDIEKKYKFWYEIWNTDYIPLIARRQKWFSQDDDLKENDVVYFKLTDTALSSKWHIGKVEYVLPSRDTACTRDWYSMNRSLLGGHYS